MIEGEDLGGHLPDDHGGGALPWQVHGLLPGGGDHRLGDLDGALPDLFFPADRSWLVSALWDDTWTCIGGPEQLIHTLERDPVANARQVQPDEDALPPGLVRD
ncbi:hypothetical protein ACH495_04090 [Micromonospora sp. NPDC018662]|uniref:hypothetical protein n=1 Tax=Micromonospora sp. NPDC018662 TaxID=3364238 RepID=UPI00378CDA00